MLHTIRLKIRTTFNHTTSLLFFAGLVLSLLSIPNLVHAKSHTEVWFPRTDLSLPHQMDTDLLFNGMRYVIMPTVESEDGISVRVRVATHQSNLADAQIIAQLNTQERQFPITASVEGNQTIYAIDAIRDETQLKSVLIELRSMLDLKSVAKQSFNQGAIEEAKRQLAADVLASNEKIDDSFTTQVLGDIEPSLTNDDINTVSPRTVTAFSHRHYAPENASIIVVGSMKVSKLKREISRQFADWSSSRAITVKNAAPHTLPNFSALETYVMPNLNTSVTVGTLLPLETEDSKVTRREKLERTLANNILKQRLVKAFEDQQLQIESINVAEVKLYDESTWTNARVETASNQDWAPALTIVKKTIKRMLDSGITRQEYEAQANIMRQTLQQAIKLDVAQQADDITASVNLSTIYVQPSDELTLFDFHIAHFNEVDISKSFESIWSAKQAVYITSDKNLDDSQTLARR